MAFEDEVDTFLQHIENKLPCYWPVQNENIWIFNIKAVEILSRKNWRFTKCLSEESSICQPINLESLTFRPMSTTQSAYSVGIYSMKGQYIMRA